MNESLGFIGLGIMGHAMASNLMASFPLSVYNRSASKAQDLLDRGAKWQESPEMLTRVSSMVFIMVSNDVALREVVEGAHGILLGLRPGVIVVDHSTVSPEVTRELAKKVEDAGAHWCDAPVTGGDVGAREGSLTIMVGGRSDDYERIRPYLSHMGRRILRVGDAGMGQTLKLVNNMVSAVNLMAASEGIQLGLKAGLHLEDIEEVLSRGSAQSYEFAKVVERFKHEDYMPGFSVENRLKDLAMAVSMAEGLYQPVPLAKAGLPHYQQHNDRGHADQDESSYIKSLGNTGEKRS